MMTDTATLDKAIADHAKWKHYLRNAVNTGQSEWNAAEVAREDQCEFGRWLTLLPQSDKGTQHWKRVKELHAKFHSAAADVLSLALSGAQSEASEALAVGSPLIRISSELVVAISAWKRSMKDPD